MATYLETFRLPIDEESSLIAKRMAENGGIYGYIDNAYPCGLFGPKELFEINFREITIFYGGNGSGKSTLLNLIAAKLELNRVAPHNSGELFDAYAKRCSYGMGHDEEGFKYLLLKRRTWLSPAFNCQFDGVVYAVFVSLGFALWENIDYVVMYGFSTALVRAVTAVPGHACFGVFMGAWYGLAKRYENYGYPEKSRRCRTLAVPLPTLLHGAYDLIATLEHSALSWGFAGFILALFAAALYAVKKLSREDRFIG